MEPVKRKNFSSIYRLIKFILCLIVVGMGSAAQAGNFSVSVSKVKDKVTGFIITDAEYRAIELPDSTVVRRGQTGTHWISGNGYGQNEGTESYFYIRGLDDRKEYILEIIHDNYAPFSMKIDASQLDKRSDVLVIGEIELVKARMLDDIKVTATKVKFYNKGDTIVYNADAFQMAEGSMLDALIAQLPGVELKDGGEIYVNGRKVENLLLNSKDFFKGNNNIMLENLGAYTVKNIAVFDRQKESDAIMGKDYGQKELTMDVRLKKEYQRGFLSNLELGYGIKDKYVGRLFGLWYNNVASIGFYGNANNISNTWNPMREGTSGFPQTTAPKTTTYSGGFDYNVTPVNTKFQFNGNGDVRYTRTDNETDTYTTNLFNGEPSTYGYSFNNSKLKDLYVYTEHCVKQRSDKWNWQITPKFRYNRTTLESRLIEATFGRQWDDIDRKILDAMYFNENTQLRESILNRNINDSENRSNTKWFNIWSNGKRKINSSDALSYLVAYTYDRKKYIEDQLYVLNLENNAVPEISDKRHYDGNPNFNWRVKGLLSYSRALFKGFYLDAEYVYQRYFSKSVSELYRSEDYITNVAGNDLSGMAPSVISSYGTLDPGNSFDSRYVEETHDLNFQVNWNNKYFTLWSKLPISMRRQWLHYMRGNINAHLHRDKVFINSIDASVNTGFGSGQKRMYIYIGYTRKVQAPDMVDMVDFTNSLDALNIRRGNPRLKDSNSENIRIYLSQIINPKFNMNHMYGLEGTVYRNSLAYGYTYDRQTGVKYGSMYNVMGNAQYDVYQSFSTDIPKFEKLNLNQRLRFDYRRSVDLVSTDDLDLEKSIVNMYGINEKLTLKYTESKFWVWANAEIAWNRYLSHMRGFIPFNALNMRYALQGNVDLPANFSLNTSLNIYARRGYSEPELNTTNFVWNARITYKAMKGQLLFMLDGFDLLRNLSNVNYSVNAQARTETYSGVVPRYFMFHVQWRFNKLPKNK